MAPRSSPHDPDAVASDISRMCQDISDIKRSLVGDEGMGLPGIIPRIKTAEKLIYLVILCLVLVGGERLVGMFLP